ncbi:MAG: N-acetylneuraminate synthase family protein [Candidatus Peregrinibacteria bacterium]
MTLIPLNIGNHTIGGSAPAFIIAEAGVNHNGSLEDALALVRAAKKSGADCVKFQTFQAKNLVLPDAHKAAYQLLTTDAEESQSTMLRNLELSDEAYPILLEKCKEEDILFLSSPYSIEDVELLDRLPVMAFKLASMHLFEHSFLQHVARKGKPVLLSTGMATQQDVTAAVAVFRSEGNDQLILLQCTTNYPTQATDANVRAMRTIGETCDTLFGFSDHTETDTAAIAAVALGASVIEKHFTLDHDLPGPDQSSSYDPREFARYVRVLRETECVLGSGIKEPCAAEMRNAPNMRRSIVTATALPKGTVLTEKHLTFKRPGTGILPSDLPKIIGKKVRRDLPADTLLSPSDIGGL